ncbi:MAG: DUF3877 family protein [Mobilitalea sp.]
MVTNMKTQQFATLTTNLEAMLHESIMKIGYLKDQPVGIYYSKDLLCHLLGIKSEDTEEAMQLLAQFVRENEPLWGEILINKEKDRYKFTIPPCGITYVYEKNKDNHFLEDLIDTLRKPGVTIAMVVEVFHKYSSNVKCEISDHDEFEYAVSFRDKTIDPFIYCFTFDEMGRYYHRFTEFDYENLHE